MHRNNSLEVVELVERSVQRYSHSAEIRQARLGIGMTGLQRNVLQKNLIVRLFDSLSTSLGLL